MIDFIEDISIWLEQTLGLDAINQGRVLTTLFAILVLWLGRRLLLRVVYRTTTAVPVRYRWQKISQYVAVVLGVLWVGRVWFAGFEEIATYLGLVSAGVAIALKDPLANMAGWALVLWRRPFVVGDRIQIGEHHGDVVDTQMFEFTLMEVGEWVEADQSTGRIIHVPNSHIFTKPLVNYHQGFGYIWHEMPVLITFESNWKKARNILHQIGDQHASHLDERARRNLTEGSQKFLIFYANLSPAVFTTVEDSGVMLTLRYLCKPRQRRMSRHIVWEAILDAFNAEPDIEFAYRTTRLYNRSVEGRPASPATTPQ